MSIGNKNRASRAVLGSLAVVLHMAFAVLAVVPPVVICHRADGGTAIELSGPWAACSCTECEHCLARLNETGAEAFSGASLAPCHCNHVPIRLAAARSSLRRDDGAPDLQPFQAPAALSAEPAASLRAAASLSPVWAGPPVAVAAGAAPLRC